MKYRGNLDPSKHLEDCIKNWEKERILKELWVHAFIHTLGTILQAWYIQVEIREKTSDWNAMATQFINNFSFKDVDQHMTETLYAIKRILFTPGQLSEGCVDEMFLQYLYDIGSPEYMACDKVDAKPDKDGLEGLRHLTFEETEGERDIQESPAGEASHLLLMKLRNQYIGIEDKPKMASVGDYWDEQKTKDIFDLLQEYQDLFPSLVAELKGVKGDIGEMKIVLKPDTHPVKHRPYRLNPRVNEKVKRKIDKMLEAGLIFLVDEA